ncbi:MAG TPA: tetratricopeptide repeat protein [Terriglobia bacterium]|nr:tetratricopeptide repeat protein [Terriglobia bacterium]
MDTESFKPGAPKVSQTPPPEDRLDTWGEIATYLKVDQRTAQRWEETAKLPVNRLQGRVYAYRSELDAWIRKREPLPPSWIEKLKAVMTRYGERRLVIIALALVVAAAAYGLWRSWPLPPPPHRVMLAVLPFENLSGDPQQEFFSNGLTEEMITELGRLGPGSVIAYSSVMAYKGTHKRVDEIGRELNVNYVLEGSVERGGDLVRIVAHLVQVKDQAPLWADSYDRPIENVLALQREVADAVVSQISEKLATPGTGAATSAPRAHPVDPKAFDAYLRGRYEWNMRSPLGIKNAISDFEQAIRQDPNYAPPYAGLADTYALLGSVPNDALPPREAIPKAKAAAEKALALDKSLAEAHASLAYIDFAYEWDREGAEREFAQALQINPGYATAHEWKALYLVAMGRADEAEAEVEKAQQLDPLSNIMNMAAAQVYLYAGKYDRAIDLSEAALKRDPNFFLAYYFRGRAYEQKGMLSEALADFQKGSALSNGSPIMMMALGHAQGVSGNKEEARKLLDGLAKLANQKYVPAVYMVGIAAGLGDKDQAFHWLDQAVQDRCDYVVYLAYEPGLDNLRADPRFAGLTRRIGLGR